MSLIGSSVMDGERPGDRPLPRAAGGGMSADSRRTAPARSLVLRVVAVVGILILGASGLPWSST